MRGFKKVRLESGNYIYNLSIRKILVIVFCFFMLLTIISNGLLIYKRWHNSAETTTKLLTNDINRNISRRVEELFHMPYHLNETNSFLIENGYIDMGNQDMREQFFSGVLRAHEGPIYSFSFGTVDGHYYGARRNEKNEIEIMRNDASTGGHSWYYSTSVDLKATELAVDAGSFDPRTRNWYKAAAEAKSPVFSPIYKHFVMDDLTVSAAWPIYDTNGELQGILGSHMLLSDIESYLDDAVVNTDVQAIIFEQDSKELIATSMNADIFTIQADGEIRRQSLYDIQNADIIAAYNQYLTDYENQFLFKGEQNNFFLNISEISTDGIELTLLSAVAESLIMNDIIMSMIWSAILSLLALIVLMLIYYYLISKLTKPIYELLQATSAFAHGDLSKRVAFESKNEIGMIASGFNHLADELQILVDNLEENVQERTVELQEKKEELQLILDSTAEAIFGIDLNGNCTFCNLSSINTLGYKDQNDLIGKNMHNLVHHTDKEGSAFLISECKIFQSIKLGQGFQSDDEIFWRADNTSFNVEYRAYPQIRNGEIIGGVVTFMDITKRKEREDEIDYLNCHDTLTGLYNRRCFELNKSIIDRPDNLPLSIIFADINGLKMTNDIFGHTAGDNLIKTAAGILQESCRDRDTIARLGGDEFIILLPETNSINTEAIVCRIREKFKTARLDAIKCSVALGYDTKTNNAQPLEEIMANAENAMYKDKTINRKATSRDLIDTILNSIHNKSHREQEHSVSVAKLCVAIGRVLNMPESEIEKLERAGYLHDIGKITLESDLLLSDTFTSEDNAEGIQQHAIVGYRLLNLFDDTLDIAEYIYNHHEHWDGQGYPRGIKGEQIPLISRIISVAEVYDRNLNRGDRPLKQRKEIALDIVSQGSGTRFDPEVVAALMKLM